MSDHGAEDVSDISEGASGFALGSAGKEADELMGGECWRGGVRGMRRRLWRWRREYVGRRVEGAEGGHHGRGVQGNRRSSGEPGDSALVLVGVGGKLSALCVCGLVP